MFRVVICEDEDIHRKILSDYVKKIFKEINEEIELNEYSSAEEIMSDKNILNEADVFLLDIKLGKMTGMDLAREIRKENDISEIIFVTSLVEYIQEGYTVRAYRYILKPLDYDDIKKHLLDCIYEINKNRQYFMIIENKGAVQKIHIKDILYIEIMKRDLTIHTVSGNYCIKSSMDNVERKLIKYNFYRCHKSYLVNIKRIDMIKNNTIFIDNEEIPVSKHRVSELKKKFTYTLGDILC